jgi:hypothetical protein
VDNRYPNETIDNLRDVLLRNGFVRCDIAACNCGSWHHRYGLRERFNEFKDALTEAGHPPCNDNGNLPIRALAELIQERDAMRLVLALICAGKAELWAASPDERPYPLIKVGAEWFRITSTYTDLLNAIGWDRARAALEGGG